MTGLGEYLKKERERKKISIEEIAKATHINPKLLEAMERNDFSGIPGIFYARNFLKTYLDAIGADQNVFFQEHGNEIDRLMDEKKNIPEMYYSKLRYSSFKKRNLFLIVAMAVLLIIAIFCFFYRSKTNLFHVVNISQWGAESRAEASSMPDFGNADLLVGLATNNSSPDYSPVNVRIAFQEKCWIQVARGGVIALSSVFEPGTVKEISGYDIALTLGNPSGLRLFVNDTEITRFRNLNHSVRLQLNPTRLEDYLKNE